MGGSSSPPPPPDYTPQHNSALTAYNNQMAADARAYNYDVAQYNAGLNSFTNQSNNYADQLAGFNIDNINQYSRFDDNVRDAKTDLQNYQFTSAVPTLNSTFSSHGMTSATNKPSLSNVNTNAYNSLMSNYDSYLNSYNNILNNYNQAVDADDAFRSGINADLNSLWAQANNSDIYADGALDLLGAQYAGIVNNVDSYNSQLAGADFSGLQSKLAGFDDWLSEQKGDYDYETQRIDEFENTLQNSALDTGNTLDGLTIRDIDQINSLDSANASMLRQAMNFDPRINTDLSSYINTFQGLNSGIDALRDQRNAELDRIRQTSTAYDSAAQEILRNIGNMGLNSGAIFDQNNNAISNLRNNISNFDSLLGANFSNQTNALNEAQQMIDNLYAQRRANIDEIVGRGDTARNDAMNAGLWEEQQMRDAISAINNEMYNLGSYTGGRTSEDRAKLQSGIDALNARLNELSDYRNDIEGRAQGLLGDIEGTQFYGQEDVDRMRGLYDALSEEGQQYAASQANDELANALSILTGNQNRLDREAEELAARKAREAQQASGELFGIDRNYILSELENTDMTPEEYQALVSRVKDQDPEFANQIIAQYGALFGA